MCFQSHIVGIALCKTALAKELLYSCFFPWVLLHQCWGCAGWTRNIAKLEQVNLHCSMRKKELIWTHLSEAWCLSYIILKIKENTELICLSFSVTDLQLTSVCDFCSDNAACSQHVANLTSVCLFCLKCSDVEMAQYICAVMYMMFGQTYGIEHEACCVFQEHFCTVEF